MDSLPVLPSPVWDFIFKWVPTICGVVGALVLLYWWKTGNFPFTRVRGGSVDGRRLDDKLLDRILIVQSEGHKAINNLADAIREQGRGFCTEIREQTIVLGQGLREVHGRIDVAIVGKKHKHADLEA